MLAQALLELADHVGMSQSAIARHLGVERSNVSYWARGKREVPEHHRETLLKLVFTKAKEQAAHVKAMGQAARAKGMLPHAHRRFFRKLFLLVVECRAENLSAHGLADTASIESFLRQLDHFKGMPQEALCKPETAHKLFILSRGLASLAMINEQHGPLMELAEELKDANIDAFEREAAH
jgi:transcriptional regulator with XRE-family HTH domain